MIYIDILLNWTWCLPQTFIGMIVFTVYHILNPDCLYDVLDARVYTEANFGLSLGFFIFADKPGSKQYFHELNHSKNQSMLLGPFDDDNDNEIPVKEANGYDDIEPLYKLLFPKATVEWC